MKRSIAVTLVVLLASMPALAIFGLGDIVYDPSNYEEAVLQLMQLEQQYEQLVRTYQTVRNQYDQMLFMAQRIPVDMRTRYRSFFTPWERVSATNTYGTSAGWVNALNSGSGVSSAYQGIAEPLLAYGSAISNVPSNQVDRLKRQYGTIEVTDGALVQSATTIGSIRRNASGNEAAIQRLEDDSLSLDPNMNTEVGVLNKINAAGVIGLRTGQDTNKLLVALMEQQVLQAQRQRDAEARAVSQHIRFAAEEQQVLNTQGITEAIRSWRMP